MFNIFKKQEKKEQIEESKKEYGYGFVYEILLYTKVNEDINYWSSDIFHDYRKALDTGLKDLQNKILSSKLDNAGYGDLMLIHDVIIRKQDFMKIQLCDPKLCVFNDKGHLICSMTVQVKENENIIISEDGRTVTGNYRILKKVYSAS
jgi:hypothetical protein